MFLLCYLYLGSEGLKAFLGLIGTNFAWMDFMMLSQELGGSQEAEKILWQILFLNSGHSNSSWRSRWQKLGHQKEKRKRICLMLSRTLTVKKRYLVFLMMTKSSENNLDWNFSNCIVYRKSIVNKDEKLNGSLRGDVIPHSFIDLQITKTNLIRSQV